MSYNVTKNFKRIVALIAIVIISSMQFVSVNANEAGHSIQPIYSSNQVESIKGYHAVKANGSLNQSFKFELRNDTKKTLEFDVELLNAYTSPAGVIQYDEDTDGQSVITNKKYEFNQYVEGPERVSITPGEKKIVEYKVTTGELNGELLGAIAFVPVEPDTNSTGNIVIKDKTRIVFGVMGMFDRNAKELFTTEKPYVSAMPSYFNLRFPIENKTPLVIDPVKITYKVEDKKGNLVFEGEQKAKFAPYTKVHFDIPFDSDVIKTLDDYVITGALEYKGQQDELVPFEYNFTYKGKDSIQHLDDVDNQLNRPRETMGMKMWGIIFLMFSLLLLLLLLLYLTYKKYKKEKERLEQERLEQEELKNKSLDK